MDVYNLMFQDEREAGMKNLSLSDLMENFVDAIQPADETKEANMEEAKKWLDEIQVGFVFFHSHTFFRSKLLRPKPWRN